MKSLLYIVIFSYVPMLCIAQQQEEYIEETNIPLSAQFGLNYAVSPDFNLPQKAAIELPFFCALEKKIALTIKSDVKLGVEPCKPIPFLGSHSNTVGDKIKSAENPLH